MHIVWGLKKKMIDKIRRLYPNFSIYIRKENKVYNAEGKRILKKRLKENIPYVLINGSSYEVHQKKSR